MLKSEKLKWNEAHNPPTEDQVRDRGVRFADTRGRPIDSFVRPHGFAHDHSHRPVLAPATLAALPSTRAIPNRDVFYACRAVPSRRSFNEGGRIREGASLIPFAPFAEIASDVYARGFMAVITTPASPARQSPGEPISEKGIDCASSVNGNLCD